VTRKVEISYKTIIFTALFVGALWFVYYIRDILLEVFVALIIAAILNPTVDKLSAYKIPRAISILITYIIIFGLIGGSIAAVIPPLVEQTTSLANSLPKNLQQLGIDRLANGEVLNELISALSSLPSQLVKTSLDILANILNVLTVLIFAFYLLLTRNKLDTSLEFLFGPDESQKMSKLISLWEEKLGSWARGQLLLMLLVGVSSYIGFLIVGIPYALPLAILAGFFELVPYLGPVVAAVPAIILGFSYSPFLGFAAVGLAFLIQQLENYLFVPKVMEKSVGIPPVITLFALAVGYRLAGVVGIIISMPVVLTIQVVFREKFASK
jgi:predicted PurR-regulated permease PerM